MPNTSPLSALQVNLPHFVLCIGNNVLKEGGAEQRKQFPVDSQPSEREQQTEERTF